MPNKFLGLEPLQPGETPVEPVVLKPTEGFRSDVSPREIRPGDSPDMEDVRFERSAVRKDFGWTPIGTAAASRVLGILEHKFIEENKTFHRLARFRRVNSQCIIEVWDGVNWVEAATSEETIQDVYLSLASSQGCVYIADGTVILEWCEVTPTTLQENDFPTTNSISLLGDETQATVTPGDAEELEYTINYDVEFTVAPPSDTTVELEFYHGAVLLGSKEYEALTTDVFPFIFLNESFVFNRQITDLDVVKIKIASITGGTSAIQDNFGAGVTQDFEATKSVEEEAVSPTDQYVYNFDLPPLAPGETTTLEFFYDDGGGWTSLGQKVYDDTDPTTVNEPFTIDGMGLNDQFGMTYITGKPNFIANHVAYTAPYGDLDVHGHNKATDGDATAGVTYTTVGDPVSQLQEVSVDAPDARFILPFADRLLAMRDGGDHQSLAWSADGVLTDWAGGDSGQIFLVDSRSDPIDDLMSGAVLADNFVALFRKRSIMRVFETGNVLQAIAAVHWIENLGTASPFSVKNVIGGAIFLGHDVQVYYLTPNGPQPIGDPIHQELVEDLTGNLDLVDAGYDPIFAEYYLGIPVDGGSSISKVWVFDVDRFVKRQETVWRRRPMNIERFGSASEVE